MTDFDRGEICRFVGDYEMRKGIGVGPGFVFIKKGTICKILEYHWGGYWVVAFDWGRASVPETCLASLSALETLAMVAE